MATKYEDLFELGCGAYGKAIVVKDRTSQKTFVSKVIKIKGMNDKDIDRCVTEVAILSACWHINIVLYIEAFVTAGSLHIIMEFASGGDLQQRIDKQKGVYLSTEVIIDWFLQVVLALDYIHKRSILHRDLKPQNIFLTEQGVIKLGDFGIARVLCNSKDLAQTRIGTPFYISPEMCERKPYNSSSDMWAAGCLLYQLCLLRVPFSGDNLDSLTHNIVNCNYEPVPRHFGEIIINLIGSLLLVDSNARLTSKSLLLLPELDKKIQFFKLKNLEYSRYKSRSRSVTKVVECQRSNSKSVERIQHGNKIRSSSLDNYKDRQTSSDKEHNRQLNLCKKDVGASDDQCPRMYINEPTSKAAHKTSVNNSGAMKMNEHLPKFVKDDKPNIVNTSENSLSEIVPCSHKGTPINNITDTGPDFHGTDVVNDGRNFGGEEVRKTSATRLKGMTYTIKDSVAQRMSACSPKLSQTVRRQRFSLSISNRDNISVQHDNKMEQDKEISFDNISDDVFSSSVQGHEQRKSRNNSETYVISVEERADLNNNETESVYSINSVLTQAVSVLNTNKELARSILWEEITKQLGDKNGEKLVNIIRHSIIKERQSYLSLRKSISNEEAAVLPIALMLFTF